jgi:hypothetical protein
LLAQVQVEPSFYYFGLLGEAKKGKEKKRQCASYNGFFWGKKKTRIRHILKKKQ